MDHFLETSGISENLKDEKQNVPQFTCSFPSPMALSCLSVCLVRLEGAAEGVVPAKPTKTPKVARSPRLLSLA
eukprot:5475375-Amphidinium_carterae.1